jgi:hypothetical protein
MKAFLTLVAAFSLLQAGSGRAQLTDAPHRTVYPPTFVWRVTLRQHGTLLTSFTFPKGTVLIVDSPALPSPSLSEPYNIASGNGQGQFNEGFELHVSSVSGVPTTDARASGAPGNRQVFDQMILQALSHAPLVLRTEGVEGVIESVNP